MTAAAMRQRNHLDRGKECLDHQQAGKHSKASDTLTSLREFGVPAEDLEGLVVSGMQVQRLLVNNMRTVTAEDARSDCIRKFVISLLKS